MRALAHVHRGCLVGLRRVLMSSSRDWELATALPPFKIVDSTLREGEQFSSCEFTKEDRVYIARQLDALGVEYIEVQNPAAGRGAVEDIERLTRMPLRKSRILAHVRCHMEDVRIAVGSGVHGVNVYMATSKALVAHSHGRSIEKIIEAAQEVIEYVKKHGLEVRFSCEDAFRSDLSHILNVYHEVGKLGVNRVGVADTVGVATPRQVRHVISEVRKVIPASTGIEVHFHNDSGCCIANALEAIQSGATHIDTTVLGLGERNGITPLGGWLARAYVLDRAQIKEKYNLALLRHLERYLEKVANIHIPFNNYITGSAAFTHKAGVHSKAVMSNPGAYEAIDPADFGVERKIQLAHRLTGWNAMKNRVSALGLTVSDDQIKAATARIKALADVRPITMDDVDQVLIKLAAGPRVSSSSFVPWVTSQDTAPEIRESARLAMQALAQYEAALADNAVSSIQQRAKADKKASATVTIVGHLFDKAVLNRLLDILVDSPCKFRVASLEVPPKDEMFSQAVVEVWADEQTHVTETLKLMRNLVEANSVIAECTLQVEENKL